MSTTMDVVRYLCPSRSLWTNLECSIEKRFPPSGDTQFKMCVNHKDERQMSNYRHSTLYAADSTLLKETFYPVRP